jgi:hypothetical protein
MGWPKVDAPPFGRGSVVRTRAAGVGLALSASLLVVGCGASREAVREDAPLRVSVEEVRPEVADAPARAAIREQVRRRATSDHASLPPPVRDGAPDPQTWPRIVIRNDTPHGLVVWVSGPCARTLALPPQAQNEAELCEGDYQLAAQLAAPSFLPLVGEEARFDDGFRYTFTFYVRHDPGR